ncbi:DUF6221 family protein [Streptomyces parvus]|uniref:DUF6221 family protein n=1 Tax=Streptomyces parvus TaxID=66428 RepID=UPI00365A66E0
MTDALVAFLKARCDELQAQQEDPFTAWHSPDCEAVPDNWGRETGACNCGVPARTLREVEAKRRILRAHEKWCEGRCEAKHPEGGFDAAHYWSIKALAAVYADHPDYLPEWRP